MRNEPNLLSDERSYECNVVEKREFIKTAISTLRDLSSALEEHCGPYSGTSILMDPNNPLAEPVFTKDGINIIDSIRYKDPVRDFIRKQLAYMGKRIDRGAGDGTTSSMFLMANTIKYLLSNGEEIQNYTTFDISSAWNELVSMIEDEYRSYIARAVNMKDKKLIRYVAESQAYTSSHGDIELAKCIGDLFANTPREVWNNLVAQRAMYESDKKYNVTINTAEYTLDNVVVFPKAGNEELGTVLHLDDVDCLIWYHIAVGDEYQKNIFKLFEERAESGEPLVVMCCNDIDVTTQTYLMELFEKHPEHKGCITFITVPFSDSLVNDITALERLLITAGKLRSIADKLESDEPGPSYDLVKLTIECKSNKCRVLKGIFNKKTLGINPFYKKKEYKEFNEYLNKIQRVIDNEKNDISRRNTKHIEAFTRVLYKLISTKDVVFTIGGSAYDNAAGRDIVMDALLATKCSLTQGFVAGRCVTLKYVLEQLEMTVYAESISSASNKYKLMKMFIDALLSSISELDDIMEIPEDVKKTESPVDIIRLKDPSYEIPKSLDKALEEKKDYCIIQPAMMDITFLKRFGELGLKFLTANSVIPVGCQWS